MRNFYEVIGTSEKAVKRKRLELTKSKKFTDKEVEQLVDRFIREKYENAIKLVEMKKKLYEGQILKQKELEEEEKEIVYAYKQIESKTLRDLYTYDQEKRETKNEENREVNDKIIRFTEISPKQSRTAYKVLGTLEETIRSHSEQENDKRIKERATKLLKSYTEELEKTDDFRIRIRLQTMIKDIEESYELIKTAEKRREYGEYLRQEKRERDIENKYSHVKEYDTKLIFNEKGTEQEDLWNKAVARQEKEKEPYFCEDEEGRKLKIKKIGEVHFLNWGKGKTFIDEYEITRILEGEEKKDIIYTNSIKARYLSIDKQTREPLYPEYYYCVMNELLSEDSIEGSKYNGGYIGEVQKDKDGNYFSTLGNGKLKPIEKEYLTAVMIMQKREEMKYSQKGAEK